MPIGVAKVAAHRNGCSDMHRHMASTCVAWTCTFISYRYLDAMMQGQDPVNFDLDDYDAVEIKASASTIGEYSAGVRMNTRKNATGHRCATL